MPAAIIEQDWRVPLEVQDALNRVRTAADTQTKTKYSILKPFLDTVTTYAENHGLSNSALQTLVDAVKRPNSFDQKGQNAIIKSLYPANNVSSELICTVIGSLGHGSRKASVSSQQLLLRWVLMVADYLQQRSHLSNFYSVLFNLLDMMSIRAEICHLLAKITRRKHVRPFRIHLLQDLSKRTSQEPALLKLMYVYDKYAPGILALDKPRKNSIDLSSADSDWVLQLERIRSTPSITLAKRSNQLASSRFLRQSSTKAKASSTIPSAGDIESLVNQLEDIKLSDMTASDLSDPVLQIYIMLTGQEASGDQIDDLLNPIFHQQLEKLASGQSIFKASLQLLQSVVQYSRYTKSLPRSVIDFFERYLPVWDGQQNQQLILDILTRLPILPLEDLQTTLLTPLETAILSNSAYPDPQTILLQFYTALLRHWTILLTTTPPTPPQTTSLTSLTTHTTLLTHTLLTTSPPHRTTSLILTHLEAHLPFLLPPLSLPIPPPPPQQIYLLLFHSPHLSTLSRLSSLLAHHKTAFESTSTSPPTTPRPAEHIPLLNATLIDTCNLLFRSRAFNTSDPHALGCLLPPTVTQKLTTYTTSLDPPQTLTALFSLSHHPALVALSIHTFREMEDEAEEQAPGSVRVRHAGPITQKSLVALGREGGVRVDWKEYRVGVLRWLEGVGVRGISELGGATMKGLLGGRDTVGGAKEGAS